MTPPQSSYRQSEDAPDPQVSEAHIEEKFIEKLKALKYTDRPDTLRIWLSK